MTLKCNLYHVELTQKANKLVKCCMTFPECTCMTFPNARALKPENL